MLSAEVGGCRSSVKLPESRYSVAWLEYSCPQLAWLLAPPAWRVVFLRERGFSFKIQTALRHAPLGLNSFVHMLPSQPSRDEGPQRLRPG